MDPARGTQNLLRDLIAPALEETFEDLDAIVSSGTDLLLSHPLAFPAPVIAAHRNVRWASSVLAPISFFSRYDLPVFPPAPWLKRVERIPGAAAALVTLAKSAARPYSRPIRRFRRRHGLTGGGDPVFGGQHSPALVLALFSPVLAAPQRDWPPNVRVTGHIPWNGPLDEGHMGVRLERFLHGGSPPIVFTLGTSAVAAAGDFYQESEAAARALGRRAVLLVGRYAANRAGIIDRDEVLVLDYASHAELFRHAAAVVHQGGMGTLQQAMRAGRPMLIVPWAHDQPDNAYRATRLDVARTLTPSRYRRHRVANELSLLLSRGYTRRAEALGAVLRAENGIGVACDAIDALLRGADARRAPQGT